MPYQETPVTESPPTASPAESEDSDESPSALLPKSMFGSDPQPGDTITLKVSAVYGDEVEVSVTTEPETEETPMSPDEEIDMMASKGAS